MKRIRLDRKRDALLVVDIQNDFCTGGALAIESGAEVVPQVNDLMSHFGSIVLTQDWHPKGHMSFASSHADAEPFTQIEAAYGWQTLWPGHCVQGTRGADFHPLLLTHPARLIIRKGTDRTIDSYSAFLENDHQTPTGLGSILRELGIRRIFLAGLATDYCVLYTARDARLLGLDVTVIEDCCRGIDLDNSLADALGAMTEAGVVMSRSNQIT